MTTIPRPPMSPRELVAFENLLRDDRDAAMAVCFYKHTDDATKAAARDRGMAVLARARAKDAAANNGAGNGYSRAYAAWEATLTRSVAA